MSKVVEKTQARILRKKGLSINKIAVLLNVSKGSVSIWCEDISLSPKQLVNLKVSKIKGGNVGRLKGAYINKQKRLNAIEKHNSFGKAEIGKLSNRDLMLLGVGLYWGEGSKGDRGSPTIMVNSDPNVILMAMRWFQEILGVENKEFRPYIYISEIHKSRENKIMNYWIRTLKIPKKQFLHIIFLKGRPKKKYENYNSYYGILALRVRRSSDLKYRILGLIAACVQK